MVYEGTCSLASTNTDSWTAFGNAHLLTVRRLLRVRRLRHLSLIFQASMSLLAVHFHRNVRSSSRALPLHLHFHTRSGVFGFTSSCNVLEPFHWPCFAPIKQRRSNHCLVYQGVYFRWNFLVANHSSQISPFRPCLYHSPLHVSLLDPPLLSTVHPRYIYWTALLVSWPFLFPCIHEAGRRRCFVHNFDNHDVDYDFDRGPM